MPYDDNQLGRDIQGIGGASAAYNRGALALAALRSTVGDAKFREIEKTWVQEHQEQTATTAEFVKFASDKSGIDLSDWSKTWLYGTEKPSAWPTEATAPTTDPKPEATVTSLSVDATGLKKTEYRTGEQFDPTGLKITATYSDKSTKAIDPTDDRDLSLRLREAVRRGEDHGDL
ncbi:bacterial Ig-like domain-containing protein [uncultured Bifidobacterium sp.]|uniref:bacterial Ig-like domain-containing protein n=1 Tax=uncultured Bifidobacterium sp. TaxID=165187 RepID=UPI00338F8E76